MKSVLSSEDYDMTLDEICVELGITKEAVRHALRSAMRKIREQYPELAEYLEDV